MSRSIYLLYILSGRRVTDSVRGLFFIPTALALVTSLFILIYISSTSNLFAYPPHHHLTLLHLHNSTTARFSPTTLRSPPLEASVSHPPQLQSPPLHLQTSSTNGTSANRKEVFYDRDIFTENYREMNATFKIYIYPHRRDDPFANILLPVDFEPEGNYASESYFKKVLVQSHFITEDPSIADLFYLPFSIARLRHDPRVGIDGIENFIREYIFNISHNYPYWNRTGGADHFYVACHSIGRTAIKKAEEIKFNAIQVVCSSSYFQSAYVPHKDAPLPQIWPREGDPPYVASSRREKLAFFAGAINSPVREKVLEVWGNDTDISVHDGHLTTPYEEGLLGSKFCLHVKGFEVNTARIGDAMYYGCVPVIISNHYDLPFADILNWKSFSIVVPTLDIPLLKKILQDISFEDYVTLQSNVLKVRKHFQWHIHPVDYDAFYMVMYELWLRRSCVRTSFNL